jgi:hypothetical protein
MVRYASIFDIGGFYQSILLLVPGQIRLLRALYNEDSLYNNYNSKEMEDRPIE